MAALDFPASPTLNQTYPAPAVPGVPVYTWDGEKWTTTGGAVGSTGAADDPPLMDGTASVGSSTQWAREDHRHPSDTARVAKTGDTMSGHLSLPTAPAAANAVRKDYVDAGDAALASSIPPAATAAEYIANSAPTKMLTPGAVWSAAAGFPVSTGAALTPDLANATDFGWVNNSSAGALNNPTNLKVGQKGVIYVWQDGVGGRLITTWGSFFKFPGGIKPVLSTAPNAVDAISYAVYNSTYIMCTFSAGFA